MFYFLCLHWNILYIDAIFQVNLAFGMGHQDLAVITKLDLVITSIHIFIFIQFWQVFSGRFNCPLSIDVLLYCFILDLLSNLHIYSSMLWCVLFPKVAANALLKCCIMGTILNVLSGLSFSWLLAKCRFGKINNDINSNGNHQIDIVT